MRLREKVRAEMVGELTAIARRHLAEVGAEALSLRAVAREAGMVSSALHRYFPTKADLLTVLITDASDAVGAAAEAADDPGLPPLERWLAVTHAVRSWALAHRHEYFLLHGTPVRGYEAPREAAAAAGRTAVAAARVVAAAQTDPAHTDPAPAAAPQTGGEPAARPPAAALGPRPPPSAPPPGSPRPRRPASWRPGPGSTAPSPRR